MLIGIDLGTTNSAVAIWRDGEAELLKNALDSYLTPSAVSVEKSGQAHVGQAAFDRIATHPSETVNSFKRFIGSTSTTKLGNKKPWKAEDLSALVLSSLCDDVEQAMGERPTEAVITVPAYFNDKQRKATRRAGELAGLTVRRLINEPTAAALAFGLQTRGDREPFLVFDLGGGTFDISIVEMFDGIVEVRASAGDNRLGGDDFNSALATLARKQLDAEDALKTLDDDARDAILFVAAEKTRRALSEEKQAEFAINVGGNLLTTTITEDDFEKACKPLLDRLREPVIRAIRDCAIQPAELSEIVLVGGATRMPAVRKAITRMFGRFPNSTVHPDHAVALGAAIQAGLLAGGDGLEEIRITDVAPFTLGVETAHQEANGQIRGGLFSPIIERNSPVPISREHTYYTMDAGQKIVKLGVYQGEARLVKDNLKLSDLDVPVPAGPEGMPVNVRFTYDSSGLLEVDAHVPETGRTHSLIIADEEDRADPKELEKRRKELAKLKFHPRDNQKNVALMMRAGKCFEHFSGQTRDLIGHVTGDFEAALEAQEPRVIEDMRGKLVELLDELEGNPPL